MKSGLYFNVFQMLEPRTMNFLEILERIREDVLQNMDPRLRESDEIVWDKDLETLLFYAMHGLKPVGVNRHFMMAVIHDRFSSYISKELPSQIIWDHLESLYDMAALHESEIIPFPNEDVEFELPEEFDDMVNERHGVSLPHSPKDESETPKNNSKGMKKIGSSKVKPSSTPNTKNAFQTPVSNKPTKTHRSDSRASSVESNVKGKQEPSSSGRGNKSSRASSPYSTKTVKSETPSTPEPSATPVSAGKKNKVEAQNSSSSKKTPKSETPSQSSSVKKSNKTEAGSSSKQGKPDTPDNLGKKIKNEKEQLSSKKGKVSLPSENSTKKRESIKGESKKEVESKRSSDASTAKSKSDKEKSSKGLRNEDADSSLPSGSRKSVSGKVETDQKKRKRTDEPGKKDTPPARRRRTANP